MLVLKASTALFMRLLHLPGKKKTKEKKITTWKVQGEQIFFMWL